MILHHACGGGLGHLTRARAVARALDQEKETLLVATSPHVEDIRVTGGLAGVRVPSMLDGDGKALGRWLKGLIDDARPDAIVIDAFPAGLLGELADALDNTDLPVTLVARDLRWSAYRASVREMPKIDTVLVVEPLVDEYEAFLMSHAGSVREFRLAPPPVEAKADAAGAWLIVHSGPDEEILQLIAFAEDLARLEGSHPPMILVAPRLPAALPAAIRWIDAFPAAAYFASADRIVTAAGFNAMLETEPYRDRHHILPFPRRFDDQHRRAARRRATTGVSWDA